MTLVHRVQKKINQSNTYKKDLDWLYFENQSTVQEKNLE